MKRSGLITLFTIGISVLFSCSKDEKMPIEPLAGKWELKASINGSSGKMEKFEAGNGKIVEFGVNNYYFIEHNKTIKQGGYSVERKISKITNREESYIIYDGVKDGILQTYLIKADELTLSIDAMDGPATIYKKID